MSEPQLKELHEKLGELELKLQGHTSASGSAILSSTAASKITAMGPRKKKLQKLAGSRDNDSMESGTLMHSEQPPITLKQKQWTLCFTTWRELPKKRSIFSLLIRDPVRKILTTSS